MSEWEVVSLGEGVFGRRWVGSRARVAVALMDGFRGTGVLGPRLAELLGDECEVIQVDLRGTGLNKDHDLTWGAREVGDLERAAAQFDPSRRIVLCGESIGGAMAVMAARNVKPTLVVASSPYDTFDAGAPALLRRVVGMPEAMISFHLEQLATLGPPSPLDAVAEATCPAVFLASPADPFVPHERTARLAAGWGGRSETWDISADHGEVLATALETRRKELTQAILETT